MAQSLGSSKVANIHLDKYTQELKQLIGKLHDDNLDAVHLKGHTHQTAKGSDLLDQNLNDDNLILDSDDDKKGDGDKKLNEMIKQTKNGPSNQRKEKLKIRLLNESQTYYQNNLNIFSNGLSLLAVNSLEVHGLVHQINSQTEQMEKLAVNIEAHSNFMK